MLTACTHNWFLLLQNPTLHVHVHHTPALYACVALDLHTFELSNQIAEC